MWGIVTGSHAPLTVPQCGRRAWALIILTECWRRVSYRLETGAARRLADKLCGHSVNCPSSVRDPWCTWA